MTDKIVTDIELRKVFITEVTNNLNSINDSDLTNYDFKLGYAVISYLIDKYKLEDTALELIQFYKNQTKETNNTVLKLDNNIT